MYHILTLLQKKCPGNCCLGSPCQHDGNCTEVCDHPIIRLNCTCVKGFQGRFCEEDVDECLDSPCFGKATCQNTYGDFKCVCPGTGYAGKLCEGKNHGVDGGGYL